MWWNENILKIDPWKLVYYLNMNLEWNLSKTYLLLFVNSKTYLVKNENGMTGKNY